MPNFASVLTDLQRLSEALARALLAKDPEALDKLPTAAAGKQQLSLWQDATGGGQAAVQIDTRPRVRARWACTMEQA